jgi:peroxiredoxin Q/BCP
MRLNPGDNTPDFNVKDINGKPVRLADYADRDVLLCFYRYAGCPFCGLDLKELIAFHRKMSLTCALEVVVFFQSPASQVLSIHGKMDAPFPIVADPDKAVYGRYGVESSLAGGIRSIGHAARWMDAVHQGFPQRKIDGDFFLLPSQFLVSEGMIALAYYGRDFGDHIPFMEIESYCRSKPR